MDLQAKLIGGPRDGGTMWFPCDTYDEMADVQSADIPVDITCAEYDHYELRGGLKLYREEPYFRCEMLHAGMATRTERRAERARSTLEGTIPPQGRSW